MTKVSESKSTAKNKSKKVDRVSEKTKSKRKSVKKSDKQADLLREIKTLKQEKETLQDRLLRMLAEMDNIKKRMEKERVQWQEAANAALLQAILPVVDDLERSLKISCKGDDFRQGIEMILQKLTKTLKEKGLSPMESVGKPFDVDMHDALLQMEKEGVEPGIVIEEHEKGYIFHGRVIRHAKVLVSK
ncbi:nucleotide exchange factor GrpE [bacterium]|nr:nucleotide exchange factor GrpE [bacterium]